MKKTDIIVDKHRMPASPYQVMAGTVIAAALVTGIKSDLPGDVIGTVTEPVYDSASGRHLLIPQGARILGRYNSQVSYGQSRVQVVWNRIILPDTSSLTLDNLVGTDAAGYAGLEDDVDWHWDRIIGGAVLTTCWASARNWLLLRIARMATASSSPDATARKTV